MVGVWRPNATLHRSDPLCTLPGLPVWSRLWTRGGPGLVHLAGLAGLADHRRMAAGKKPKKSRKVPDLAPAELTPETARWAVRRLLELAVTYELEAGTFARQPSPLRPDERDQRSVRPTDEQAHRQVLEDVVRLLVADARAARDEDFHELLLGRLRDRIAAAVSWAKANVSTASQAAAASRPPLGEEPLLADAPTSPFASGDRWFHVRGFVAHRALPDLQRVALAFFGSPLPLDRVRAAFSHAAVPDLFDKDTEAVANSLVGALFVEGQRRSATTLRDVEARVKGERAASVAVRDRAFLRLEYAFRALGIERPIPEDVAAALVDNG